MSRTIKPTKQFKKDLKLMERRHKDLDKLEYIVNLLADDMLLTEECFDHNLKGKWINIKECHIEANWLLIYRKVNSELILYRTGTHSDLFN